MSNSVDPDEPSHLDLRCLQSLLLSPVPVKELICESRRRTGLYVRPICLKHSYSLFQFLDLRANFLRTNSEDYELPARTHEQNCAIIVRIRQKTFYFIYEARIGYETARR